MSDAPHWTEPGAFEVADGIHRIPLPLPMDGLRAVNVYTVETEEGLTLIDGGWAIAESRAQLDESLASIGRSVRDIRSFLVTHVHRDHYTQAVELRRIFGSKVSLGAGEHGAIRAILGGGARPFEPQIRQLQASGADVVLERLRELGAAPRAIRCDHHGRHPR